ncbi:hypothetical protein Ccrd_001384 [Cynara cardunculus var. scolymus]|uniref:Uncharacterized protein n=1 Tax=Cynara cardunculus var. scolymus TaxID=59895 RepID=A0A103XTA9_CYNCS|nr:hypothetical protein Ccrd_001384 [Cynara cardunculus var. scolymus]
MPFICDFFCCLLTLLLVYCSYINNRMALILDSVTTFTEIEILVIEVSCVKAVIEFEKSNLDTTPKLQPEVTPPPFPKKAVTGSVLLFFCNIFIYQEFLFHSGIGITFAKALLPTQKLIGNKSIDYRRSWLVFEKISRTRPRHFVREGYGAKYAISVGRGNHELSLHNDVKEPFWLAPTKGFISGVKSLFAFLAEQPSQLKYIEWPGFQNTVSICTLNLALFPGFNISGHKSTRSLEFFVKTACLTLVLVAMLIVVLSSVDSGLWYLLVKILRKPA